MDGKREVASQIEALAGDKTPVMCCFESIAKIAAAEWCHRHLAALWLSHQLGIEIAELDAPHRHNPECGRMPPR